LPIPLSLSITRDAASIEGAGTVPLPCLASGANNLGAANRMTTHELQLRSNEKKMRHRR